MLKTALTISEGLSVKIIQMMLSKILERNSNKLIFYLLLENTIRHKLVHSADMDIDVQILYSSSKSTSHIVCQLYAPSCSPEHDIYHSIEVYNQRYHVHFSKVFLISHHIGLKMLHINIFHKYFLSTKFFLHYLTCYSSFICLGNKLRKTTFTTLKGIGALSRLSG